MLVFWASWRLFPLLQKQLTAQLTTYQGENIALLKEFGSKSAEETMRETIAPMLAACGFDEFGVSSHACCTWIAPIS